MIIAQYINTRGKSVKNHFTINIGDFVKFQSYNTLVAVYDIKKCILYKTNQFYSNTTSKHLNDFIKSISISQTLELSENELNQI